MSKIQNEKIAVENTNELNDLDLLNDILENEKNTSNNYSIALNEMSNNKLYKEIFELFKDTKELAREAYNIAFQKGWYTLETAEESKINVALKEAEKRLNEI